MFCAISVSETDDCEDNSESGRVSEDFLMGFVTDEEGAYDEGILEKDLESDEVSDVREI